MKRVICLILLLSLGLSGCALLGERIKEPVTFYYLRADFQYGQANGVIASEEREASGHLGDLSYLMALYLMGPTSEELVSPIPRGTRIFSSELYEDGIHLEMTDTSETLSDAEFALACACLTMTCLDLFNTDQVTILSGTRSHTMTRDTLTLYDGSTAAVTTEETQ